MNGKHLILMMAAFCACSLVAETLLEVWPGEIVKDSWQKDRGTFKTGSHRTNVTAEKEKTLGFARYLSDSSTYYQLHDMKNCGTASFTVTALVRFHGKSGESFVFGAGAGSHLSPGYRLGVKAEKGRLSAYVMFVAASTRADDKKFVTITMDPKFVLPQDQWTVLTLSANRAGDLQLFVNGELAGTKSIKAFETENLFPKSILFATFCPKAAAGAEEPLQTDIARLIVRNELLSSSQILAEAEELLDETKQ